MNQVLARLEALESTVNRQDREIQRLRSIIGECRRCSVVASVVPSESVQTTIPPAKIQVPCEKLASDDDEPLDDTHETEEFEFPKRSPRKSSSKGRRSNGQSRSNPLAKTCSYCGKSFSSVRSYYGHQNQCDSLLSCMKETINKIAPTEVEALAFLRQNGLIRKEPPTCPKCQTPMTIRHHGNKERWRCSRHKFCQGCLIGSIFEDSHLTFRAMVHLLVAFAHDLPVKLQSELAGKGALSWGLKFRKVCGKSRETQKIGGPGHIVVVREALFARPKDPRQNRPVKDKWVFGGVDVHTGKAFLEFLKEREEEDLKPLVIQHIAGGSIICSEQQCTALKNLASFPTELPYQHKVLDFADPQNQEVTNHIMSVWNDAEERYTMRTGSYSNLIQHLLNDFLWRRENQGSAQDVLGYLLRDIRALYPVP